MIVVVKLLGIGRSENPKKNSPYFYPRYAGLRAMRVVGVRSTSLRTKTKYLFLHIVFISHPKILSGVGFV